MNKIVILFLLLLISPFAKTQIVPWFFNTHTFRHWAIQNDIKTLAHISYEPQLNTDFDGFTHQTSLYHKHGESPQFVKLKAHYKIFKFDSSGHIKSLSTKSCEIAYLKENESDENNAYFKELMLKMASKNQFPEKTITRERIELGSAIYSFRSAKIDSTVSDRGEGVRSAQEIIYRESGINSYDENTALRFSYDFELGQVIEFNNNAPVKLTGYGYGGDFYEPIVRELSFVAVNDSVYNLQFNGINTTMYDYSAIDTSYRLNYSIIRSVRNSSDLPDSVKRVTNINSNDSIDFFTYLLPYSKYPESSKQNAIVENYQSSFSKGFKETTFHSIYISEELRSPHKAPKICFPFEFFYHESTNYVNLVEYWHYNQLNTFLLLKTVESHYKTGEIKKVEQFIFLPESNGWKRISVEKYGVNGQLIALNFYEMVGSILPFTYLGERNDLGFFDMYYSNMKVETTYDEDGNFELTLIDDKRIVKTTNTDLIMVTGNNGYKNSSYYPSYSPSHYFEAHFLIIR